ncbi:MAG: hypothetical protein JJU20_09295 [Opitutales bacterium]|nr:hypothetical protein [Opitutales bacterium]
MTLKNPSPVAASDEQKPNPKRFTVDGDAGLEAQLEKVCDQVQSALQKNLKGRRLKGVLLGGGYGRGEGGVFRTEQQDRPYNDLEFYLIVKGNPILNERRMGPVLDKLVHELSSLAGVEVEFKILGPKTLRRQPVSMFTYDLIKGHKLLMGDKSLIDVCGHHRKAEDIPMAEATRLLMNRCIGLVFAMESLEKRELTDEDADNIGRNLAKVRLALGDAVLVAKGRYHWSCRERSRRINGLPVDPLWDWFGAVLAQHERGVDFKLNPKPTEPSRSALLQDFESLSELAGRVWLWLESLRLERDYDTFAEYVDGPENKCPETGAVRNGLINFRRFGLSGLLDSKALRYPRERLYRALPILLWDRLTSTEDPRHAVLKRLLRTEANSFKGYVSAYRYIWQNFR